MIEKDLSEGILTLRLAHGKASALDMDLLQALSEALRDAASSPDTRAVILTGSGSIFSAGVDLKQILQGREHYAHRFVPLLDQVLEALFAFPKPLVAAVNGHAIAGGAIMTLACDIKLMASGKARMGVPELKVGVPFPAAAFEILRFAVPRSQLQLLMYQTDTYPPEAALARGMVDELVAPDELLTRAQAIAGELASIPADSFTVSKRMQRDASIARMHDCRNLYGQQILDSWSHDATYEHIQAYLDKTLRA